MLEGGRDLGLLSLLERELPRLGSGVQSGEGAGQFLLSLARVVAGAELGAGSRLLSWVGLSALPCPALLLSHLQLVTAVLAAKEETRETARLVCQVSHSINIGLH